MNATTAASHTLPLRNCYWVVPGLLLAGEHPNGPTRDKTKERLKKLMGAGIECFVDLTKPTELLRYDTFLPFHVEYARKSIKDHGLPSGRSQMTEILEYIAQSMRAGRPVYVHCRAGIGRTGTVVGCLLAERGLLGNDAIDELNRLWQQCRRSRSWPFIPETDAQAHYVREWQPALDSGFELSSLASAVATVGPMSADGAARGPGAGGHAPASGSSSARGKGGADGSAAAPRRRKVSVAGAGRTAGAGLRAAAEQARAAVERGEVQVKAPPAPASAGGAAPTMSPTAPAASPKTPPTSPKAPAASPMAPATSPMTPAPGATTARSPSTALWPQPEFAKGEISPTIRAEIADAMAGRNPASGAGTATKSFSGSHGTAAPNDGEEAPWASADSASPNGRSSAADGGGSPAAGSRTATLPGARLDSRGPLASESEGAPQAQGAARGKLSTADATGSAVASPSATPAKASPRAASPTASPPAAPATLATPATASPPAPNHHSSAARPPASADPVSHEGDSDPFLHPDTLAVARGLRERFVGTLFGLAVGDAVAAATQFRRPGSFSPVGDMLGGGPFDLPRGAWSDDTAMALCLAESLLERDGFDARDQVQRYGRWQQDGYLTSTGQCVGITANTARSLALAKWRRGLVFPGSHDPDQLDPEPLSRVAAIAMFYFASLDATLLQATDSARITCQAPAVLDACKRLAGALNAALSGQPKTKILAEAGPLSDTAAQTNTNAASALSAAFWAFSSTDNFRDAILRAANVGGNSDVVAAVCGQLAGAHYGATAIPQSWRSGLMQKDLIEGIADRMLAHALVSLST